MNKIKTKGIFPYTLPTIFEGYDSHCIEVKGGITMELATDILFEAALAADHKLTLVVRQGIRHKEMTNMRVQMML